MAVTYFSPDTVQQSNPVLAGVSSAQGIYSQGVQNAYLPQTLSAQLKQLQLANAGNTIRNQYLAPSLQSQIGLANAQTGLANAQTQYFPMTAAGQYYGGMGRYLQGAYAFSPIHQYSAIQNNPNTQSLIASNPNYAQAAANITAGALSGGLPGGGIAMPGIPGMSGAGMPNNMPAPGMQAGMQQGSGSPIPGMPAATTNMPPTVGTTADGMPVTGAQQNTISSLQGQIGAMPPSAFNGPTANDISAIQNASGSEVQLKTTPNAVLLQRQYSQILDPLLAKGAQLMPSVAKYSGLQGTGKLLYDKSASALGINSPDYTNYQLFTNTLAPNIANELRRVLGGQATDSELKVMDELADPTYWHSNPQLALQQYQYLTDLYQKTVNPAIAQSPAQVQQNLQQSNANIAAPQAPQAQQANNAPQASKTLNGKSYVKINGKWYQQ
jgi:hypothetical protein